jgi:hypothetical protein
VSVRYPPIGNCLTEENLIMLFAAIFLYLLVVVRRAVDDLDSPPGTATCCNASRPCTSPMSQAGPSSSADRVKRRSQGGFEESELGFLLHDDDVPNSPVELLERTVEEAEEKSVPAAAVHS